MAAPSEVAAWPRETLPRPGIVSGLAYSRVTVATQPAACRAKLETLKRRQEPVAEQYFDSLGGGSEARSPSASGP